MTTDEVETTLVLADRRDEDGSTYRGVRLTDDGGLVVEGHDLGPAVSRFSGHESLDEYEFARKYSPAETSVLAELLHVERTEGLLDAIRLRFSDTRSVELFLASHGIAGDFWSRVGG